MKYYAVTDDPTELMHYGIKGMKWGIIRTDAQLGHPKKPKVTKPRSPAYMKASSKLSSAMQKGIAKAQTKWNVYNSPANKQLRAERRNYNKVVRDYKRGERKFEKHVQLARQGRLKYKGISDSEVQRITDRLALERNARILSGTEKQSFRRRLGESVGNGIISGVGQGTASYINQRMTGRGQTTARIKGEQRMAQYHNSWAGKLAADQENRYAMRNAKAEQERANVKARIQEKYNSKKADRDLRDKYAEDADALGNFYLNGHVYGYGTESSRDRKRLTTSEMRKRLKIMSDANDERSYKIKRERERSENEERDSRELEKAERQMIRDVMRDKRTNEIAIYNAQNKEYTERKKAWDSADPATRGRAPTRPTLPAFVVDDYYKQYDELVKKRTRGRR